MIINKYFLTIIGIIFVLGIVFVFILFSFLSSNSSTISASTCVSEYSIVGELTFPEDNNQGSSLFADERITLNEILSDLKAINKDKSSKALILVVNSPGGSVYQTKEIFNVLKNFSKPIVVYYSEMGTSGAFYIGLPAKYIVAHPNAIIGSIGVRLDSMNIVQLLDKIGVNITTYKSGKFKDILSSTRNVTSEDEEIIRSIIVDVYNDFVADVKQFRGNKIVDPDAFEAKIYTGKQAKKAGLVDEIGSLDDARKKAFELVNLSYDEKNICKKEKKRKSTLLDLLVESFYYFGRAFGTGIASGFEESITKSYIKHRATNDIELI
ncbi:MAG: signal peptide peptidase SppA [Candidatus Micrarchaeota archaeon]|nr:signal peptide peptidase SppA [Candidatus Micrarchaeota archaeon]